jgi:hypothetical protein
LSLEKAPWPHSCARTHNPIATVPVTALYAAQNGKDKMLLGLKIDSALTPTNVHRAVPITDTAKYDKEVAVSGSNESSGRTALISRDSGKSSGLKDNAFPFIPENAIPVRSGIAPKFSITSLLDFLSIATSSVEGTVATFKGFPGMTIFDALVCDNLVGTNAWATSVDEVRISRATESFIVTVNLKGKLE